MDHLLQPSQLFTWDMMIKACESRGVPCSETWDKTPVDGRKSCRDDPRPRSSRPHAPLLNHSKEHRFVISFPAKLFSLAMLTWDFHEQLPLQQPL